MIIKLQNVIGCVPFSIHKAPPPGWKYLGRMPIGEAYQHKATSLTVISSIDTIENENCTSKVLHVSVSRKSRLPSWDDLKRAKNTFMGLDVDAYHVIPKADDHVNLHNYCMHLWAEWTHPNDDHRRHLCPKCSAEEAVQKGEDHAR